MPRFSSIAPAPPSSPGSSAPPGCPGRLRGISNFFPAASSGAERLRVPVPGGLPLPARSRSAPPGPGPSLRRHRLLGQEMAVPGGRGALGSPSDITS